ncbi:MAG: hypothetical protein WAV98_01550 [Minisyncoccia bacterium]
MNKKTIIIAIFTIVSGVTLWSIFMGGRLADRGNPISQQQKKEIVDNKIGEWKMYQNKEFGISFQYPDIFKRVNIQVVNGDTGRRLTGVLEFAQNHWISFGGVTKDFTKSRGGSLVDTYGYEKVGDAYLVKFVWGDDRVVPSEFWSVNKGGDKAIVVRNTEIGQVLSNKSVAVFVNIPNSLFPGIVFEIHPLLSNESVDEKEIEILRQIVSSITFSR